MQQLWNKAKEKLTESRHKLGTVGVVLIGCVVAYHVVLGSNGLLAYHQKRTESQQLSQQIKTLQHESGDMEKQIQALKYDPKAIEKEARERLRYARKGEKVYTLPPPSSTLPANQK